MKLDNPDDRSVAAGELFVAIVGPRHDGHDHVAAAAAQGAAGAVVRQGFASLNEMDETEEDLLDRAWGLEPDSRLSCQAIVAQKDLVIEIPKYTINHARENH